MQIQIGPYRVEGEVGRGGMGVVYRAIDERLSRVVAIKALPPELAADPNRLERFEREAKTLASVNHQNLAGIHGVEEQDGHQYLILEYVEGETLADRLDRGPLPVDEAVEVCVQIATGIEAAHDAGVIHRDLKPSNIKITPDGRVKVLDFGLAKGDSGASSTGSGMSQSPTMTTPAPRRSPTVEGAVLGTAAYMSPEQARGRGVDKRTDIWSFGVILYECLTGIGPFVGETATDSIGAVLHKEVELGRLPAGTPLMVRHVLARCLERDKQRRYRDIADVRIELERAGESPDRQAEAASSPSGGRTMAAVGWAMALLAIGVALWLALGGPAPEPPAVVRSSIVMPEGMEVLDPTLAPDGRSIAIVARTMRPDGTEKDEERLLYRRDLATGELTPVPGARGVWTPKYSPDGRTLAYLINDGNRGSGSWSLSRVDSDLSSAPVKILEASDLFRMGGMPRFSWTPDGRIAFVQQKPPVLVLVDPGTGREIRRLPIVSEAQDNDFLNVLSPFGEDSIHILLQRFDETGWHVDSALVNIETGEMRVLLEDAGDMQLAPNGDLLFVRGETLYSVGFDPKKNELVGQVRSVQSGLARENTWEHGWFSMSRNGSLLYVAGGAQGGSRNLMIFETDGTQRIWPSEPRAYVERVAISDDGSRFAVIVGSPRGVYEIWVSEVDQPRLRRLLAAPGADYYGPVFTPDGQHLLFSTWNPALDVPGQVMITRFDGTETPRALSTGSEFGIWVEPTSVSNDGTKALLNRYSAEGIELLEIRIDGEGEPKTVMPLSGVSMTTYAPGDDSLLTYISAETGRPEAYVRRYEKGEVGPAIPVTTRGAESVRWLKTESGGLALRCVSPDFVEFDVPIVDTERLRLGEPVPTSRIPTNDNFHLDMAPTGRAISIRKGDDERAATRLEFVQGWIDSVSRDAD